MQKILLFLSTIIFLIPLNLNITGCIKDEYLEITNDDIYDNPDSTGKINKIAFTYMCNLPKKEKLDHYPSSFYKWKWNLDNRKKIIGYNSAGTLDSKREYWKITLLKTKKNGIYVSEHKKSYKIIE